MKVENLEIDKVIPYFNNPRKNMAVEKVAMSIKEYGFQQPIVVDNNMSIIVGHTRYEAAKSLNLEKIPVVIANISHEKAKAYRIADNKTNESSIWDYPLLNKEFSDLMDANFDLEKTGFDEDELEKIITHHKDDENAEFPNIEDIQTRDFEEMTFILSIEQGKFIKDFLTFFKSNFDVTDEKNTNSNGNALYIALKNFSESIDKK
jgi:ParB-like chromosome segregation protein Spo0J|tara:strand:+ start:370 stop:984 length:615 start_codon:yes stop_codon:yes gene_type:complete